MKKAVAILALIAAAVACAPSAGDIFLVPNQTARPPVAPHRIAVYDKVQDVPGEFDEIGVITVRGSSVWTRRSAMIESLQEKAAAHGANAVYIASSKDIGLAGKALTTYYTLGLIGRKSIKAVMVYIHEKRRST